MPALAFKALPEADLLARPHLTSWLSVLLSATTVLVFLVGFAQLLAHASVPMVGSQWQPQGRYFFPGLVIIATLFAFGIRRLATALRPELLAAVYIGGLLLFNALSLFGHTIPCYHG